MKILLAEDTRDLNHAICTILAHEGYETDGVLDGAEAVAHLEQSGYDCIILDIMMPKMDGLEVLSYIRKSNIVTPVLLLTAKSEVEDRVSGLDAGADDYLSKPFAMKELLARIRALTRRYAKYMSGSQTFFDLSLDAETLELTCENTVRLSIKEFELMQTLIGNARQPLTTAYLLSHVWEKDPDAGEDTVWLYISYLKRKLQAVSSKAVILGERGGTFTLTEVSQ